MVELELIARQQVVTMGDNKHECCICQSFVGETAQIVEQHLEKDHTEILQSIAKCQESL